jgi:hypothetical protein
MANIPSIVRPVANRAVHLRITPRPSNIGESREIMRLVSQFGEVEYFKSLRYDAVPVPNAIIAIFRDEEGASNCMRRSPIRFRMGRAPASEAGRGAPQQHSPPSGAPASNPFSSTQQIRSLSTNSQPTIPNPPPRQPLDLPGFPISSSSPGQSSQDTSRIFQITSNPARVRFRDHLNTSHFNGHFKIDTKSAAQQDLAKRVPTPGLSDLDWRAAEKPWHVFDRERELDGASVGSGKRRSLKEIWAEGERARKGQAG